ncbi:MAG: RNase adapter RapZ [Rubrimonas sp.]
MTEAPLEIVLVTGLSGAGRSTALGALEDRGWETVDNLPLALIPRLAEAPSGRPLALGVAAHGRGFSTEGLIETVEALRRAPGVAPSLVFLDAADEALIARYAETRRRHPIAPAEDAATGVARERDLLGALRDRADLVIDTTALTPHQLKAEVQARLSRGDGLGLVVSVQSFSYKRGAPREADMVMDVRFLRNPHWEPELRPRDGRDAEVAAYVARDPLCAPFFDRLAELVLMLLPAYKREGKAYFGIGLGCTGGRHRSVALAERLAKKLVSEGWRVTLRHRELERRPPDDAAAESGAQA